MRKALTFLLLLVLCLGTMVTMAVTPVSGPGAAVAATGESQPHFFL